MSTATHPSLGIGYGIETPYPESPWVVMKFGGTSVATVDNWAHIAKLLRARLDEGLRPMVVHSALAGVSNALIALLDSAVRGEPYEAGIQSIARQHAELATALAVDVRILDELFEQLRQLIAGVHLVAEVSPRVHARVLATGELAATQLGAAFLHRIGVPVTWQDARSLLCCETVNEQSERSRFLSARCDFSAKPSLQQKLSALDGVVLTQGFIARNADEQTVLLGRGGSDTSAAYLAAMLEARRLENWTDVPGFFSADPKAVPSARLLQSLHYSEAQEIASAGGGILNPRSISPVRRVGIPLFIKCTAHPEWGGTVISTALGDDTPQLKAISKRGGITLIAMESFRMWGQAGFLADAFAVFQANGVSVDLISTSESNVTVSVDRLANAVDDSVIEVLVSELEKLCRVELINDCAAITLVGRRIRAILHELTSVFQLFEEHQVHLVTQAANDLNLTFVVSSEHAYRIVQDLHRQLVGRFEGGVFGATWEQFSGILPTAMPRVRPWWMNRRDELLGIAAEHGSAYVYEKDRVKTAIASLQECEPVSSILYAMKANSHPEVLKTVHEHGLNFECVSPGEMARVLKLFPDMDRRRILFTPNFAPRSEYATALEQGVWVTLDNLHPLQHWPELFRDRDLFIRVDTGQGRGHHEHVRTAGVHSKFGVPLFETKELAELANAAGARIVGLHAHTGSGVLTADAWRQTGQQLVGLLEQFPLVRHLDLGGGLGIPEKPGQQPLDMAALGEALSEVKEACGDRALWLEPGRYLVAEAGVLLARVTQIKGKGDMQYVGVETGMNSLIRPALYGAYHEIVNLSRLDEPTTRVVTVVGPICETGDRLGSDRFLPETREGDVLAIANAGAYGFAMSSNYNLRPPAREVVI